METFRQFLANEAGRKEFDYSSVLVEVPSGLSRRIKEWGRSKVTDGLLYQHPTDSTFGRESYPHVTILYGIHTDKPVRVRKLLKEQEAFTVTLGKMSFFKNERFDVLKIEVTAPDLFRMNKSLKESLYCTSSPFEYKPHLTVAYLRSGKGEKFDGDDTFAGEKFDVSEVIFSSRERKKTPIKLKVNPTWIPERT